MSDRDFEPTETFDLLADDTTEWLPLPWNMPFYDDTVSEFYVSSNGFAAFDDRDKHGCCAGLVMPDDDGRNGIVAVGWTDLDVTSGGTISWGTNDSGPWAAWQDVPITNASTADEYLTGYVIFSEFGSAQVHIDHLNSGPVEATVGAEENAGLRGTCDPAMTGVAQVIDNAAFEFDFTIPPP